MNLLLVITVITALLLVISLVSDVRQGLGIAHISVALLLSVALLVGIWIMDGLSKSQDAARMAPRTLAVSYMALHGELLRPSDTKNSLLTRSIPSLDLVSRVLTGSASGSVVVAPGAGRSGRVWTHTHCRKSCFGRQCERVCQRYKQ